MSFNGSLSIDVDLKQLEALANDLAANQPQIDKALKSTLSKMAAWLKVKSIKGLSAELGIQQNVVRRRLRAVKAIKTHNGASVKVWYGLNPIGLIYLRAKETSSGVKAMGGRFVKDAFITNVDVVA